MGGPTIEIRCSEPGDAAGIREIYSIDEVVSELLFLPYPTLKQWVERLQNMSDSAFSFVALIDDELVGHLVLHTEERHRRRHVGVIGLGVRPSHQRLGVADALMTAMIQFCDDWLNLRRIELTVYADNTRAQSLYLKHGFEKEGVARDFGFRCGKFVDAHYMARVKTPAGAAEETGR